MPSPWDDLEEEPCLVAGLGNPGARYRFTRHNAGFMVVDRVTALLRPGIEPYGTLGALARGDTARGDTVETEDRESDPIRRRDPMRMGSYFLLKPLTYMNLSGLAVGDCADRGRIRFENLLVVNDDFNLPLGRIRFRPRGSAGGHNGLKSIIRTLGTEDFPRLRIGVGPLPRGKNIVDFVLDAFDDAELELLDKVLDQAGQAVREWLTHRNIQQCMNRFNRVAL